MNEDGTMISSLKKINEQVIKISAKPIQRPRFVKYTFNFANV